MCNCINEIDKKLDEKYKSKESKYFKARLDTVLMWSNELDSSINYPRMSILKNKPNVKKNYEDVMIPIYCPFCGEKYIHS